jgi:hypothetical protein
MPTLAPVSERRTRLTASLPYPYLGSSQHLCLARSERSTRSLHDGELLHPRQLPHTVLASAYFQAEVQVPTLLEAHPRILLPPLRRCDLLEEQVHDQHGQPLGTLLRVPALFVHANNLVLHSRNGNVDYDYEYAVGQMVREAGRLLASVLKTGLLKVREKPGFMAHIQTRGDLRPLEAGITMGYARQVGRAVWKECPELFRDFPMAGVLMPRRDLDAEEQAELDTILLAVLDGFPCWTIRFPLANDAGIQPMRLRIVPGRGRVLWLNPWNLEKRFLGDEDGDLGFVFLRTQEVLNGELSPVRLEPLGPVPQPLSYASRLSLRAVAQPESLLAHGVKEKTLRDKWLLPDLTTTSLRKEAIHNADTRQHVAVYTMAAWWIARVLCTKGGLTMQEAYAQAYQLLEFYMENCMDARKGKGNSAFAGAETWDPYQHMETLLQGGEMNFSALEEIGMPADSLGVLKLAWELSGQNLRGCCEESPVYYALVLRRKTMEKSLLEMLEALLGAGIGPERIYDALITDLTGGAITYWPDGKPGGGSDAADYSELVD